MELPLCIWCTETTQSVVVSIVVLPSWCLWVPQWGSSSCPCTISSCTNLAVTSNSHISPVSVTFVTSPSRRRRRAYRWIRRWISVKFTSRKTPTMRTRRVRQTSVTSSTLRIWMIRTCPRRHTGATTGCTRSAEKARALIWITNPATVILVT